jgi:hypothetical protein
MMMVKNVGENCMKIPIQLCYLKSSKFILYNINIRIVIFGFEGW